MASISSDGKSCSLKCGLTWNNHTQPFSPRRLARRTGFRTCAMGGASRSLYENYRDTVNFDTFKEHNRQARRMTFTFDDWKRHRSSDRYLYHLKTLSESGIVRGIAAPVLFITVFTAVVAAFNVAHSANLLPAWVVPLPNIAIEPIQLTSIALSLLLVFRTNASYSRWDEGRRSFGSITTVSRDIARQAFTWFLPDDTDSRPRLGRWLVALGRVTMVHLREEHNMKEELRGVLEPQEIEAVTSSVHAPSFCLQMITWIIRSAGLPQELIIRMDENVSLLTNAVSACERILNTPIPLSYTRHTARFLMAWLVCLPFSLWSYCGLAMIPIAALVAFVLLGIEEIGVYIEEPFSILALEKLVNKLENIVNAMLRESKMLDELSKLKCSPLAAAAGPVTSGQTASAVTVAAAAAVAPAGGVGGSHLSGPNTGSHVSNSGNMAANAYCGGTGDIATAAISSVPSLRAA